ncbi:hypothetical protein [Neobacillus massiliamazoniensis]|uniref:Uncharacterized protein n=1 Tax=Neobacillus massiliamazoniensis TaxID=1499688 RepID=A0A0U1NYD0_9BACI|nr:hypothetical protein [Neobacillus massiliamazoniensis]CRK83021.1 hypothetical protein BN000_02976 [Neobacillus massiliamazoniensis]
MTQNHFFSLNTRQHGTRVSRVKQENTTNAAIASLRIALKNYFSTYDVSKRYISIKGSTPNGEEETRLASYLSYQEKYLQTIFHFHHFLELLIKDELRSINPLLAVKLETDNAKSIMDLIQRGVDSESINNQTVEFMVAVKRLKSLAGNDCEISIIVTKYLRVLTDLNTLRNRAWHRGTYILLYSELDRFIGLNVLPCVLDFIENSQYKNTERYWKYKLPKIGLDPINMITKAVRKEKIDYSEVAFYKAIGLASYNIPTEYLTLGKRSQSPSERKANALIKGEGYEVLECFVCGKESLVSYREDDWDYDENNLPTNGWWRIYELECEECGLKVDRNLRNPHEYGINIPDLWVGGEL